MPSSPTSASQSAAFLVGQIFVRQNATTCLSLRQEHSSADGVSVLQPQPSGTRFHAPHLRSSSINRGQFRAGSKANLFIYIQAYETPLRTFVEECIFYITLHCTQTVRRRDSLLNTRPNDMTHYICRKYFASIFRRPSPPSTLYRQLPTVPIP